MHPGNRNKYNCYGLHVGQQVERSKDGEIEGSRDRGIERSEDKRSECKTVVHTRSQRHMAPCDVCKVLDSEYGRKADYIG
jgi:hypothetical protein